MKRVKSHFLVFYRLEGKLLGVTKGNYPSRGYSQMSCPDQLHNKLFIFTKARSIYVISFLNF